MGELRKVIIGYIQKQKRKIYIGIGLVFLTLIFLVVLLWPKEKQKPEEEIVTTASLEKIINVSELSTFESIYNGIARVMNEKKPEKVDYYVSYEAVVKAGVDFQEVDIALDKDGKTIIIDVPEVIITEVIVESGSMEFIFENEKVNTETVSQQAYKACLADVRAESEEATTLKELAEQNAKNVIEALVKPFVMQLDAEYTIEIR
ncbi:MAG: DUF4230 domain-containing protein [Lachnospiraceae bacterium]|nr:DUF4230 domain-containing protein [Lachnospiraceae bacterium]